METLRSMTRALHRGNPYRPSSPYSSTKAASDMLVRAWTRTYGLRTTISNCSNNYGPYQHVEKFIPRQITNVIDGIRPKLYGDGKNVRDWIHTEDHSSAVWTIPHQGPHRRDLPHRRGRGEGQHHGPARHPARDGQARGRLRLGPRPPRPRPSLCHRLHQAQDRAWMGAAHTDFESGLAETIEWYRDNEAWWRPAKEATEAKYAAQGQ